MTRQTFTRKVATTTIHGEIVRLQGKEVIRDEFTIVIPNIKLSGETEAKRWIRKNREDLYQKDTILNISSMEYDDRQVIIPADALITFADIYSKYPEGFQSLYETAIEMLKDLNSGTDSEN